MGSSEKPFHLPHGSLPFSLVSGLVPSVATEFAEYLGEEQFGQIAAFLVVLIATLAAASMIRWGLGQLVTRSGLSSTDRILGFAFGTVRGGILVTILLMVSQSMFSDTELVGRI